MLFAVCLSVFWGGEGEDGEKREEKGRETVFLLPSLFLYSPPVPNSPAGCERRWVDADPAPEPAYGEGAGLNVIKLYPVLFHRAECVLGRRERPPALAGFPVTHECRGWMWPQGLSGWVGAGCCDCVSSSVSPNLGVSPRKGMLRFPANKLPADRPSRTEALHVITLKPGSQLSCRQTHIGVQAAFPACSSPGAGASLRLHAVPQELCWLSLGAAAGIPWPCKCCAAAW